MQHPKNNFKWKEGVVPLTGVQINDAEVEDQNKLSVILNNCWRPSLTTIGCSGIPPSKSAGNVIRSETVLTFAMRYAPTTKGTEQFAKLKEILEKDPPFGAIVSLESSCFGDGFNSPVFKPRLLELFEESSKQYFDKSAVIFAEGASIPVTSFLASIYPNAQSLVTGCNAEGSNCHCPNESLNVAFCKKLICCVTHVLANSSSFL